VIAAGWDTILLGITNSFGNTLQALSISGAARLLRPLVGHP